MKNLILILFIITITSCNNRKSEEIVYRNLFEINEYSEYKNSSGATIDNDYSVGCYSKEEEDNSRLIIFEKIHRDNGLVNYSIVDKLLIENIPNNHYVGYGDCRIKGKVDREIIVLYEYEDAEYYTKIKKAWRADRNSKKIIKISTENIDCINEGWGV